ncbi:hypothetical protein ACLOJK_036245 [Asimina triloba]
MRPNQPPESRLRPPSAFRQPLFPSPFVPAPSHGLLLLQPRSTAPSYHLVATIAHLLSSSPFLSSGCFQGFQPPSAAAIAHLLSSLPVRSSSRHRPSPFFPASSLLHFPPSVVASSFAVSATACSDFFPNPKPISSQIDFAVSATASDPDPPSSAPIAQALLADLIF